MAADLDDDLLPLLMMRALRKRRTWLALFLLVSLLLFSSWNLLASVRSWYRTSSTTTSPWPALYASVLYGAIFGLLALAVALALAVPAIMVTWITGLVLLAFTGKPRAALLPEVRRVTADIAATAVKMLLREASLVAVGCAAVSLVVLLVQRSY